MLLGDTTPLYLAAGKGFTEVVDVLLKGGADKDHAMPVDGVGSAVLLQTQPSLPAVTTTREEERLFEWSRQFNQAGSGEAQLRL